MERSLSEHLETLKSVLLKLTATGESGFEGLVATVLREVTGVPFRFAASGRQFGVDGKPTYDADDVAFEAKRYDGKISRESLIAKIADLARNGSGIELWVVGATSSLSTQLADELRKDGRKAGISVLLLDWAEGDLPPLAVALALGGRRVDAFLQAQLEDESLKRDAIAALDAVRHADDFEVHAERIRTELDAPTVGTGLARTANSKWLTTVFSDKKLARTWLGQPMAPGAESGAKTLARKPLADQMKGVLTGPPVEGVVVVHGDEGCGKSWLVAQAWLAVEPMPLMIVCRPDDFQESLDLDAVLVRKLIEQTGDDSTEVNHSHWRRRLAQWRRRPPCDGPRLIVFIDGINQRPEKDWGQIVDRFGVGLSSLGGRIIVTSRTHYYNHRVRPRLPAPWTEIEVPEWTIAERDEILLQWGVDPQCLHQAVANSLRNPRLLAIALELLSTSEITGLTELSGSRLLFEHIRRSEVDSLQPQPAIDFVRQLREHAKIIISRVEQKQEDDRTIFDAAAGDVADGRFFHPLDGEPDKYELKDDGLTLALGFAVVDRLRQALRNSRDVGSTLETLLEPVAALGRTADVVLAALTVVVMDEEKQSCELVASLLSGFAELQNPDATQFPAFSALARRRPVSLMKGALHLCITGAHQPNFDWIEAALLEAAADPLTWSDMADEVRHWLSAYSLAPELGLIAHPRSEPSEKVLAKREERKKSIDERLVSLSSVEGSILAQLHEVDGDLSALSRMALYLLAGKPLAPFADCLVNWSFAHALNSDNAAYDDFLHLVRLNRQDWHKARAALLAASKPLRGQEVSRTGQWALVAILRATGDPSEAQDARCLTEALTKDRPPFPDWRLVEDYCTADPCDPSSKEPSNVRATARKYKAIDVGTLRQGMGNTTEDHFFDMARPAMARFVPDVAISKHRGFADDVLQRTGLALRQGLFELRMHTSLLTVEQARSIIARWRIVRSEDVPAASTQSDRWLISQYHLLLAFPFLGADEQLDAFLSLDEEEAVLLDVMDVLDPLDEASFDRLLNDARATGDERRQYLLLAVAASTETTLSSQARDNIASLVNSSSERLRTEVLEIAARSRNTELLAAIAGSGWRFDDSLADRHYESWYGSMALLDAARNGLVDHLETVDRIAPHHYGQAASILDGGAVREIARRVDAAIVHVAGLKDDLIAPDVELRVLAERSSESICYSVNERESPQDLKAAMLRFTESDSEFEERQNRNWEAFDQFRRALTRAKANIILDHLNLDGFAAIVAADESLAERWYKRFMELPESRLRFCHNLITLLGYAMSRTDPPKAAALFEKVRGGRPTVRITFGHSGVELGAMTVWSAERSDLVDLERFLRLDRAGTDHDLALEVLAALKSGNSLLLKAYIEKKMASEVPAEIARGVMVAGFSDRSPFNTEILSRYEGLDGMLRQAHDAARYAYDRNCWARHWFEQMCIVTSPPEFWRYSILFQKIVDGRFEVWRTEYQLSERIARFWPSAEHCLKHRYQRWERHRGRCLFGGKLPAVVFMKAPQ